MSTGAMYPTDMYAKCDTWIVIANPQSVIDRQQDRWTLPDKLVDITHDEAARINESTCSRKLSI